MQFLPGIRGQFLGQNMLCESQDSENVAEIVRAVVSRHVFFHVFVHGLVQVGVLEVAPRSVGSITLIFRFHVEDLNLRDE